MEERKTTLFEDIHRAGYDREEEYFFQLNKELIEQNRMELDQQRHEQERRERGKAHWLKCPKCGSNLREKTLLGLTGDLCESCGGVFFDRAELNRLALTHTETGFKEAIKRILAKATMPRSSGIGQFPV